MASLPTPKELIKLANACRKAGIKHFRCGDYEFSLSDEAPVSNYKRKQSAKVVETTNEFESDSLTEDQLLMWSTGTPDGEMEIKSDA